MVTGSTWTFIGVYHTPYLGNAVLLCVISVGRPGGLSLRAHGDGSGRSLDSPESQCSMGFQPVFCRTERWFTTQGILIILVRSYRTLRDGSLGGHFLPGTSCPATISLVLRDKNHPPIEAPQSYLSAYGFQPGVQTPRLSRPLRLRAKTLISRLRRSLPL
jgi:hypothetical protein